LVEILIGPLETASLVRRQTWETAPGFPTPNPVDVQLVQKLVEIMTVLRAGTAHSTTRPSPEQATRPMKLVR